MAPPRRRALVAALAFAAACGLQLHRSWVQAPAPGPESRLVGRRAVATEPVTVDLFDPWTTLGICPSASLAQARVAYKKMITKHHPDVDPTPEGELKFHRAVRAYAVITGEDKELDQVTLLRNAVENLQSDLEYREQQLQAMKLSGQVNQRQARAEQEELSLIRERLEAAQRKREEVGSTLGMYGGAAIGLVAGGPPGLLVGAAVGMVVGASGGDGEAVGKVLVGTGSFAQSVVGVCLDALRKVGRGPRSLPTGSEATRGA